MIKTINVSDGFSVIEGLLIIVIFGSIIGLGLYIHSALENENDTYALATKISDSSSPKFNRIQQNSLAKSQSLLNITQWGVEIPLSSVVSDAYYVVSTSSSKDADGLPGTVWLGLKSLSSSACNPANNNNGGGGAIGALMRILPSETDAATGQLLTKEYPNGVTIGSYYYAYGSLSKDPNNKCPQSSMHNPNLAFTSEANKISAVMEHLIIKEWDVELTLTNSTLSLYYYIPPNNPDVAYFGLKTIDAIAPECAANNTSLGAIGRLTGAQQQAALANPSDINTPGYLHVGNYWYNVQNSHAACGTPAQYNAISQALPGYGIPELLKVLNSLAPS